MLPEFSQWKHSELSLYPSEHSGSHPWPPLEIVKVETLKSLTRARASHLLQHKFQVIGVHIEE